MHPAAELKAVIRRRCAARIGAGPDQYRRTWKYFSPGRGGLLNLDTFGEQLATDLNIRLSKEALAELKADLSGGANEETVEFRRFVTRCVPSAWAWLPKGRLKL